MRKTALLIGTLLLGLAACQSTSPDSASSTPLNPGVEPTATGETSSSPTLEATPLPTASQLSGEIVCGSLDESARSYYNRAMGLQKTGEWDKAKMLYERAIEADPGYCDAMDNLGLMLRQQGDLQGAVEWYLRSIEIAPHNTIARRNLAVAYGYQGKTDLAANQYKQIIAIDPGNPEGYFGLAGIFLDQERYAEAVPYYEEAARLYESSGSFWAHDAYHGLGIAMAELDQCKEAVSNLKRVYDEYIYDAQVNYYLGYCYLDDTISDPSLAEQYLVRSAFLGMELPQEIWDTLPHLDLQLADDLRVIYAYFGIFELDDQGSFFFPTDQVPYREGLEYGWIMILDSTRGSVCWREEYELPAPPRSWGTVETGGDTTIAKDGRTATTEFCQDAADQVLGNSWILQNGDPLGPHEMRIYVDGVPVRTFEFVVGLSGESS